MGNNPHYITSGEIEEYKCPGCGRIIGVSAEAGVKKLICTGSKDKKCGTEFPASQKFRHYRK